MQGRLENELKTQQSAEQLLKDMPCFVNEWYINMRASKKTASSCLNYIRTIRRFLDYICDDISNATTQTITLNGCESFMIACQTKTNDDGLLVYTSDSYQLAVWCTLNNLLSFLAKRKYIEYNFMEDIDCPKNHDLNRINNERILLTQRDFYKILNAAKNGNSFMGGILNNRDVLIILLFMTTGMRKTALSEINISDIDFNEQTLQVVDKGQKTHIYPLGEQVMEYIELWLQDRKQLANANAGDALFINRDGNRIAPHGIYDLVKKYCKAGIGKELSPHKLRAGFCSILYSKTHDVEFVRRVVGHSNIQTTQRYIKTDGTEKEKAIQIMGDVLGL